MRSVVRMALFLGLTLWGQALLAHGLPGTSLTFQPTGDRVALRITMPLEELNLVLDKLGDVAFNQDLPAPSESEVQRISNYLMNHLFVADLQENIVQFSVLSARIDGAFDDHVGDYQVLVVQLSASQATFPLTLRYDAIMHEVRNHRATVFLERSGVAPVKIGTLQNNAVLRAPVSLSIKDLRD